MVMTSLAFVIPLLAGAANPASNASSNAALNDDAEVQALKRDVDDLRAEVQALRFTLSEIARLERQQAEIIDRTLHGRSDPTPPPKEEKAEPIRAIGKRVPAPSLPKPAAQSTPDKTGAILGKVKVPKGEPIAYVYVENVRGALTNGKKVAIDQSSKQFVPSWAVVEKGTTVEFPNQDNIYHNVFSRSTGNSFDLGLYRKGDSAKSHRFIRPGPVDVFCNIHPQMSASILVVPNRHFAKVQPDGSFVIEGVPPGRRKVVAWAPGSSVASEWVEVLEAGTATIEIGLESKGSGHSNKFGKPYGSYP